MNINEALDMSARHYKTMREDDPESDLMAFLNAVEEDDRMSIYAIGMPGHPVQYLPVIIEGMERKPMILVFQSDTYHFVAKNKGEWDESYVGRLHELYAQGHPNVTDALAISALDSEGKKAMVTFPDRVVDGKVEWLESERADHRDVEHIEGRVFDALEAGMRHWHG